MVWYVIKWCAYNMVLQKRLNQTSMSGFLCGGFFFLFSFSFVNGKLEITIRIIIYVDIYYFQDSPFPASQVCSHLHKILLYGHIYPHFCTSYYIRTDNLDHRNQCHTLQRKRKYFDNREKC